MKVLIFDRKIETIKFLAKKFYDYGVKIILAENGSKFISHILNNTVEKFDAIIISKKELQHYNISETYLLKKIYQSVVIASYSHNENNHIKNIKIISSQYNFKKEFFIKKKIKRILKKCNQQNDSILKKQGSIGKKFFNKLPKKSAILLEHLLIKKEEGLSDTEICKLFWGQNKVTKKNSIYNHIYNLRKSLNSQFNNLYIIHKDSNRYKLIQVQKKA